MTHITVTRQSGKIVKVFCDGHTDYGEEGEDIVCAALSSIVQTAVLGLMQVAAIPVKYKTDAKKGTLLLELPDGLQPAERNNADMILETMYVGIADLSIEYGKYIKLTAE
ncbi:MAG: ribosomal-processing cysteine protease Prp [Firmicutes bacterium]|nr:ribosomal-processing cysteine protease Prp [Bacillota bacterium]